MTVKTIRGARRFFFNLRVRLWVFFFFIKQVAVGALPVSKLVAVLRRLEYFLGKLQENKFVAVDGTVRLGLYIPQVATRPFETACRKFATFGRKLNNTTVLVSVTSACRFRCEHCYQKRDHGKDVDIEHLLDAVSQIQNSGAAFFNIEGGEPFLVFDRLKAVCETIDERSEIWVNSTGDGMTEKRLRELKALGLTAVMFPLHSHLPEKHDAFMGKAGAFEMMSQGARLCHEAGVTVAFNMCLGPRQFQDGTFEACMAEAKEKGAAYIQMIKPKAAGGWLEAGVPVFSDEDLRQVKQKVTAYNHDKTYADYPAISAQILEEAPEMFGCTAGGTDRYYLNAKGDVQPCEFLNVSFGNIKEERFIDIYNRMRTDFETPGTCWLCEQYAGRVRDIVEAKGVASLPLTPEQTARFMRDVDRGAPTELYHTIEKKMG